MENVQIIGIEELTSPDEEAVLSKLSKEYYEKIQRVLNNETKITLHIKAHTKGGKAKKWDLRVKVMAPTRIFESQESDWDFARAMHKAFNNIERQLEHTFKKA